MYNRAAARLAQYWTLAHELFDGVRLQISVDSAKDRSPLLKQSAFVGLRNNSRMCDLPHFAAFCRTPLIRLQMPLWRV